MKSFGFTLALYDQQLITDAQAICGKLRQTPRADLAIGNVSGLRPHYKAIVEAYENQFHKRTSGPHEETVGIFFDNYVHDSLAGFGKDATLPSDPRVVYVGGDVKLKFASLKHDAEPAYG